MCCIFTVGNDVFYFGVCAMFLRFMCCIFTVGHDVLLYFGIHDMFLLFMRCIFTDGILPVGYHYAELYVPTPVHGLHCDVYGDPSFLPVDY